ncbi:MAG: hypothetical protein U0835_03615 [Isosphaeraceae bacterium]
MFKLVRTNLWARLAVAVAATAPALAAPAAARAQLVVSESFDYGATGGALNGKGSGVGFSAAWTAPGSFAYTPDGLTFGTLQTTGGAVSYTSPPGFITTSAYRPFTNPLGATTYGSYLLRIDSRSGTVNNTGLLLASSAGQSDANAPLAVSLPVNVTNAPGRVLLQFLDTNGGAALLSGAQQQLAVGTTYLALFKYVAGASNASSSVWVLTSDQYDNLVSGGLTEAELNGASIGSGASNVWARASVSANVTPTARSFLSLFGFVGSGSGQSLNQTFDEIRLSNTSLSAVAPQAAVSVPEPGSLTLGLLVAGCAAGGAAWHRRGTRRRLGPGRTS